MRTSQAEREAHPEAKRRIMAAITLECHAAAKDAESLEDFAIVMAMQKLALRIAAFLKVPVTREEGPGGAGG